MSENQTEPGPWTVVPSHGGPGWRWSHAFWTYIWLVFVGWPAADIVGGPLPGTQAVVATGALVVFVAGYVLVTWPTQGWDRPPPRWRVACLGLLGGWALLLAIVYGSNWIGLFIYVSVAGGAILPLRFAGIWAGIAAVATVATGLLHDGSSPFVIGFLAFLSLLVGVSLVGVRRMVLLIEELQQAREEVARLAVGEERLRFARDLHDLLGHSLSVVVLKSELAGRLIQADPGRAAAEVADIESVARNALVEVRQAVSGYREQGLAFELDSARTLLAAAGIEASVHTDGAALPDAARAVLGWAVREGTTNVLRHSGAGRCSVEVHRKDGSAVLEIIDDGVGGPAVQVRGERGEQGGARPRASGHGLEGLAERVRQVGGDVLAGPRDSPHPGIGYQLTVCVPLDGVEEARRGKRGRAAPVPPAAADAPGAVAPEPFREPTPESNRRVTQ